MLSTALGFPKDKKAADHYFILAMRPKVFPKCCYCHKINAYTKEMPKLTFISLYCIDYTRRNIFTNGTLVTLHVSITAHEKMAPPAEKFCFSSPY